MTDNGFVTEILDAQGNETLQCRAMRVAAKLVHGTAFTVGELDTLRAYLDVLFYEHEDLRGGVPF